MNSIQQYVQITRELESVRQEFEAAMPECPNDVAALARCIHEKCFDTNFDINTALEHCCTGAGSIYSKFKRFFGRPPGKYLERCRLTAACRLLTYPHLEIANIGIRIGYEHRESFTRAFGRSFGYPPSEYQVSDALWFKLGGGAVGISSDTFLSDGNRSDEMKGPSISSPFAKAKSAE